MTFQPPKPKLTKQQCSFDPWTPAISADCIQVPHIGSLFSAWREYLREYEAYLLYFEKAIRLGISFSQRDIELQRLLERVKKAAGKYQQLGGRLCKNVEK
jgi:hypothetical protein